MYRTLAVHARVVGHFNCSSERNVVPNVRKYELMLAYLVMDGQAPPLVWLMGFVTCPFVHSAEVHYLVLLLYSAVR